MIRKGIILLSVVLFSSFCTSKINVTHISNNKENVVFNKNKGKKSTVKLIGDAKKGLTTSSKKITARHDITNLNTYLGVITKNTPSKESYKISVKFSSYKFDDSSPSLDGIRKLSSNVVNGISISQDNDKSETFVGQVAVGELKNIEIRLASSDKFIGLKKTFHGESDSAFISRAYSNACENAVDSSNIKFYIVANCVDGNATFTLNEMYTDKNTNKKVSNVIGSFNVSKAINPGNNNNLNSATTTDIVMGSTLLFILCATIMAAGIFTAIKVRRYYSLRAAEEPRYIKYGNATIQWTQENEDIVNGFTNENIDRENSDILAQRNYMNNNREYYTNSKGELDEGKETVRDKNASKIMSITALKSDDEYFITDEGKLSWKDRMSIWKQKAEEAGLLEDGALSGGDGVLSIDEETFVNSAPKFSIDELTDFTIIMSDPRNFSKASIEELEDGRYNLLLWTFMGLFPDYRLAMIMSMREYTLSNLVEGEFTSIL